MNKPDDIETYRRKWSNMSLLYRVDQIKKVKLKESQTSRRFALRRRSDYFYIQETPGSTGIFLPDSQFRESWELLALLLIIYQSFIICFVFSYVIDSVQEHFTILLYCDLFFLIEVLLNLNTGYFSDGTLVKHRRRIILKYAKSYLLTDILACIPLQYYIYPIYTMDVSNVDKPNIDILKIFWGLKLLNVLKIPKIFSNMQCHFTSELVYTCFHLIKFLLTAVIIVHFTSCLMYLAFYNDFENTGMLWNMIYDHNQNTYLRFFYLIVMTMTSTGYGDIVPYTLNMKLLGCIIMCFACCLFAFLLTNGKDILLKYNAQDNYFRDMLLKIKKFLTIKKIDKPLRFRVVRYLEYVKQNSRKNNLDEDQILSQLSLPLREEVFIVTRGKLLNACMVISKYSIDFLRILTRSLSHGIFAPGDNIIKEGELTDSLYFITKGRIEMFHQRTQTVFKELKAYKYFGEISFYLQKPRSCSARSLIFSEVMYLTRYSMNELLRKRPKDQEYHKILVIQAQNNISLLDIRCYLCKTLGHIAKDCKSFVILLNKLDYAEEYHNKREKLHKKIHHLSHIEYFDIDKHRRYSKYNIKGKRFEPKQLYKENPKLQSKCSEFLHEDGIVHYKYNISEHYAEESEDDDVLLAKSSIPLEHQYTNKFIEKRNSLFVGRAESGVSREVNWIDDSKNSLITLGLPNGRRSLVLDRLFHRV